MNCNIFTTNLFAFTEGTLSGEIRNSMESHRLSCASCARILDEFISLEEVIRLEKAGEPSPFTSTRLLQRLETEFAPTGKTYFPALTRILQPVALAIALLFGILIGSYTAGTDSAQADVLKNSTQNVSFLKSNLFISDFTDDDKILVLNK